MLLLEKRKDGSLIAGYGYTDEKLEKITKYCYLQLKLEVYRGKKWLLYNDLHAIHKGFIKSLQTLLDWTPQ